MADINKVENALLNHPQPPMSAADAIKVAKHLHEHLKKDNTLRGEKGLPGHPGNDGPKGDKGDRGDKGDVGIAGPVGDSGPTGDQGPRGFTGGAGADGPPGPQGIRGEKGDMGQRGIEGQQGPKGDKGDRGAQGAAGERGPKGDKGDDGIAGANYSCRARLTKSMTVNGGAWMPVPFDVNDHVSAGFHSVITDNHIFAITFPGIYTVHAQVNTVDKVRIVFENDLETGVVADGNQSCFTEYKFRKHDKIQVQVFANNTCALEPKGFVSPVFIIRKVDKAG